MTHRYSVARDAQTEGWSARLRREREARGLSQAELGRACGVSGVTISHYEAGRTLPGPDTYRLLCRVLEGRIASPLAEAIRARREARGLTQEDVATDMHVGVRLVLRWEQGLTVPSSSRLLALSRLLGADLFDDAGVSPEMRESMRSRNRNREPAHGHRRPGPEPLDARLVAERICLRCGRPFVSAGPHNRIGPCCHGRPSVAWSTWDETRL